MEENNKAPWWLVPGVIVAIGFVIFLIAQAAEGAALAMEEGGWVAILIIAVLIILSIIMGNSERNNKGEQ